MNNRRSAYYPVLFYLGLLALVWLVSLMTSIFELFGNEYLVNDNSLVTATGLRWALRNAVPSIDAAPWGTATMLLVSAGLLRGSGILRMLWHLFVDRSLTKNEKRSLVFALMALVIYISVLYVAAVSSWEVFTGVTGELSYSPCVQGWLMLAFVGVLFVSMIYGFIYGNYRSITDIASTVGSTFVLAMPALMAMIPASGLVACLQYTGLMDYGSTIFVDEMIYLLPYIYIVLMNVLTKKQ